MDREHARRGCCEPSAVRITPFAHLVTVELDPLRVVLRDEHRRLAKLADVWMRQVEANLLRAHHAFQKAEMCSPAEYQTA